MDPLPDAFWDVGRDVQYERVTAGSGVAASIDEIDLDELIARHSDVLSDLLRRTGLIRPDSELKLLAGGDTGQLLNIDVLFAEVRKCSPGDPVEAADFRRLVVVEDKLAKSREQRRLVLAQIIDYARDLQAPDNRRTISATLMDRHRPWFEEYEPDVDACLRRGDFLLVVTGDRIDERLVRLIEFEKQRLHPTSLTDLALVGLGLFTPAGGGPMLFLPHLVGAVARSTDPLTIKVTVVDEAGKPLAAEVETVALPKAQASGAARAPSRDWDPASFDRELRDKGLALEAEAALKILGWASDRPATWNGVAADGSVPATSDPWPTRSPCSR